VTNNLVNVSGGEVVVAALAAHGVEVAWGIPGTHNLTIFDALGRYGIRTIATTHEQGAGYAADGYARTARRPGVAIVTSGPAVYNAATAIAQAYSDSSPVLLISPAMPRSLPVGGPGTGYLHEAKDQTGAMDRIAAACLHPTTHQEIADEIAHAFTYFSGVRPRPVHVEIPLDLLEERGDATIVVRAISPVALPAADSLAAVADELVGASRILIAAGGGAADAAASVVALAELLGAAVGTSINGAGVIAGDHPLSLGARLWAPPVLEAANEADVLLVIGCELAQSDLFYGPVHPNGRVIRIDIDAQMANINVTTDVMLTGDASAIVSALTALVSERLDGQARPVGAWIAETRASVDELTATNGKRWLQWVAALEAALDDDAVIATDNAMCVYYGFIQNYTAHRPASLHFPTGFGTLGFTVPVAIGAACAAPDRQVIGISGDGGLLFTVPELATAAAEQLPIAIVVFDNSGYGEIRNEMLDRGEQPVAVAAPPRDLVQIARGFGATAMHIDSPEALTAAVRAARTNPGPTVLVVPEAQREEEL
jgi:acetolactate synthase-1/2/3 large subunit